MVVGARSREQVEAVAEEIGGEWVSIDVADRVSVEHAVSEAGELDLLIANASAEHGVNCYSFTISVVDHAPNGKKDVESRPDRVLGVTGKVPAVAVDHPQRGAHHTGHLERRDPGGGGRVDAREIGVRLAHVLG